MRDRRVAPHIWQTRTGWRVMVRGFDAATGRMRPMPKRLPPSWTLVELEEYRDTFQLEAKRQRRLWRDAPRAALPLSTFAADAQQYLDLEVVKAMPSIRAQAIRIRHWITVFGDRSRRTITAMEITNELQKLRNSGYSGSTVNKFRTALMALYTTLDGRSAANPVRDTITFDEAELHPRGHSYDLLVRILAQIPATRGVIERTRIYRQVWCQPMTTIAPAYSVSASFLKRVCKDLNVPTPPRGHWAQPPDRRAAPPPLSLNAIQRIGRVPEAAKARARLEVLAWTGMDPSQLARMGPEHISLEKRHYITPLRQKGGRRRTTPRAVHPKPLSREAAEAFQRLIELDCLGTPFDPHALRRCWYRAQAACEQQLRIEYGDPSFTLPRITLKDIRHSFATALYERTQSLDIVRQMIDHAPNSPLTIRYALGAVPSVLRAHVRSFPRRVDTKSETDVSTPPHNTGVQHPIPLK